MDETKVKGLLERLEAMKRNDRRLAKIGSITYAEAGRRAAHMGRETGREILQFLKENGDGITEAEALMFIPPALRGNYRYSVNLAKAAQANVNKKAGIGLQALGADFDEEKAANLAKHISEVGAAPEVVALVEQNARHVVDATLWKNAAAHENAGLQVRVIRTYDGVGLHGGKDGCEWCLERVGEWAHVADAQAAGAFERHAGCGCEIIYQTVRLNWQRQGKDMTWRDMESKDALKRRKSYGL
ncbi:MAG: hypothetical protein IKP03_10890 [Fibrobacter sp.]|nr:hypothetical protein [Fibrobacter sp.]